MAHEFWPEAERRVAGWVATKTPRNGDMTPELLLDLHHRLETLEARASSVEHQLLFFGRVTAALRADVDRLLALHPQLAEVVEVEEKDGPET